MDYRKDVDGLSCVANRIRAHISWLTFQATGGLLYAHSVQLPFIFRPRRVTIFDLQTQLVFFSAKKIKDIRFEMKFTENLLERKNFKEPLITI